MTPSKTLGGTSQEQAKSTRSAFLAHRSLREDEDGRVNQALISLSLTYCTETWVRPIQKRFVLRDSELVLPASRYRRRGISIPMVDLYTTTTASDIKTKKDCYRLRSLLEAKRIPFVEVRLQWLALFRGRLCHHVPCDACILCFANLQTDLAVQLWKRREMLQRSNGFDLLPQLHAHGKASYWLFEACGCSFNPKQFIRLWLCSADLI